MPTRSRKHWRWLVALCLLVMPCFVQAQGETRPATPGRTVVPQVQLGALNEQARERLVVLDALVQSQNLAHAVIVLNSEDGLVEMAWLLVGRIAAMQQRGTTVHVVIDRAGAVGVWPALAVRSDNLYIRPQATLSGTQGYRDASADLLAGDPLLATFTEQDAAALRTMANRNNHPEAFTASLVTPLRRSSEADRHMTRAWSSVRWTRPAHRGVPSYSASETSEAGFAKPLAADAWPQAVRGMMVHTDVMRHREAVVAATALDLLNQMKQTLGRYTPDQMAGNLRPMEIQAREMGRAGPGSAWETVLVTREQTPAEVDRDRRMIPQYYRALDQNLDRAMEQARQILSQVDLQQPSSSGDRGRAALLRQVLAFEQPLELLPRGMREDDEAYMRLCHQRLVARLR